MQIVNGKLIYTKTLKSLLQTIQKQGNHDVLYKRDHVVYGTEEKWNYPKLHAGTLSGDCEDIALYKRKLLVDAGVPTEAMMLTICRTPSGEGHCVLCITTDHGDYILCNTYTNVVSVKQAISDGVTFLFRQKPGRGINEPWDVLT